MKAAVLAKRELAGDMQQAIRLDCGHIGRDGGGRGRQCDTKFGKAGFYRHAPFFLANAASVKPIRRSVP